MTLLERAGARVLVNAMDLADAQKYLGGSYEFMGVAVRAKEIAQRRPEMVALTRALADALKALRTMSGEQLVAALPKEMTTGLDIKQFGDILARYRDYALPGSRDHRSRRRQARRPEPHRRRPAQARCQHFRAARHDDRRGLNAARLRPDDFLRRRAGARTGEPRRPPTASS